MEVGKFISGTVGVVIMVILTVNLALPTVQDATKDMDDGDSIKTMLLVIPTLLVVAIIVGIVAMFISKRNA